MTTLKERCRISEQCLPDAPYREMLTKLHDEMLAALAQQGDPHVWMIQGSHTTWKGEFAEIDAKAEAKRCGGTCYAYPLYAAAPAQPTSADYAMGYAEGFNDACKPAPQPVQEVNLAQYSACSNNLRTLGKPYPRTCKLCGLGPCKNLVAAATPKDKP